MAKYLVIVPARSGSKGIRFKNLLEINGLSLIGRAVTEAIETELDVDVVLSSENKRILDEGQKYGARPHRRPDSLSTDMATTFSVVEDVLISTKYNPELVVVLQPTSPFRTSCDIIDAISLAESRICDSVVSVCEEENHLLKTFYLDHRGYAKGVFTDDAPYAARQSLPAVYKANGAIFIVKPSVIRVHKRMYGESLLPFIMSTKNSIDIDSLADLEGLDYKLFEEKR